MADRTFNALPNTPGVKHVYMPLTLVGADTGGGTAPTLSEGDPNGSYFTVSRTAAGNYALTTKDGFLANVIVKAEGSPGITARASIPVQNSNGTWTTSIYTALTPQTVTVGAATVTGAGTGYTSAPTITYNNAHGNVGLKGTVTVSAGGVTAVRITEGGLGTDGTAPTITLTGGGGTGATATVALNAATNISASDLPLGAKVRLWFVQRNSSVTP